MQRQPTRYLLHLYYVHDKAAIEFVAFQILKTVYLPEETRAWLSELSKPSNNKVSITTFNVGCRLISFMAGEERAEASST